MKKVRSPWKYSNTASGRTFAGRLADLGTSIQFPKDAKQASSPSAQHTVTATSNPGERAFQANCGRCHNPPEQLSTRIAGTVLRHMRERALLSPQDERDILKYLAP